MSFWCCCDPPSDSSSSESESSLFDIADCIYCIDNVAAVNWAFTMSELSGTGPTAACLYGYEGDFGLSRGWHVGFEGLTDCRWVTPGLPALKPYNGCSESAEFLRYQMEFVSGVLVLEAIARSDFGGLSLGGRWRNQEAFGVGATDCISPVTLTLVPISNPVIIWPDTVEVSPV